MTNTLFIALSLFSRVVVETNGITSLYADDPMPHVAFALRPSYNYVMTNKCDYCKAVEDRNRHGWLVHIEGSCSCKYGKVFDHYDLVPVDGKELTK